MNTILIGRYGQWSDHFDKHMTDIFSALEDPHSLTDICNIMRRFGSDKGDGRHNYTKVYDVLLRERRSDKLDIFEVGLGTNNEDVLSSMGPTGIPGASLRGWREYLPNARIVGADIDKRILFHDDRIETYFVDQLDASTIAALWREVETPGFDLMIDDGLHTFEANATFVLGAYDRLNPGGIFIIEDIIDQDVNLLRFDAFLRGFRQPAALIRLPHATNHVDNIMAIIGAGPHPELR